MPATDTGYLKERLTYCRRKFLGWLGKAGTLGAVLFLPKSQAYAQTDAMHLAQGIGLAVGPKRLDAEPSEIFDEFMRVRSGIQIAYYQLFWPIHMREGKLDELTKICDAASSTSSYEGKEFQLRALPALAHAHAVGSPEPEAQTLHESAILKALETAASDRDALELLWRGMIGGLIRNRDNWRSFRVGSPVLQQAFRVIEGYLSGESILFAPAILAWQFLLTYQRALRPRDSVQESKIVQQLSDSVLSLRGSRGFEWFELLSNLFERRTSFVQMLPQSSEVVMGHQFSPYGRRVNHYFMATHLERVFVNSCYLDSHSRYVSPIWANEIEKASLRVLSAYGFTPTNWRRMRSIGLNGDLPLSADAIAYWDKKFIGYEQAFYNQTEEVAERAQATNLARWVPFRAYDEHTVAARTWPAADDAFEAFAALKLRGAWQETITTEARRAGAQTGTEISQDDILDAASEVIDEKARQYSSIVEEIAEETRSISSRLATIPRKTSRVPWRYREGEALGTPPTLEERPMARHIATSESLPNAHPLGASAPGDESYRGRAGSTAPQTPVVGLKFETAEGFKTTVDLYERRRFGRYLATAGNNTLVIPRDELDWIEAYLKRTSYHYKVLPVRSLAEASPERAAELRRRGGLRSKDLFAPKSFKRRIEQLRRKRDEARRIAKPKS